MRAIVRPLGDHAGKPIHSLSKGRLSRSSPVATLITQSPVEKVVSQTGGREMGFTGWGVQTLRER